MLSRRPDLQVNTSHRLIINTCYIINALLHINIHVIQVNIHKLFCGITSLHICRFPTTFWNKVKLLSCLIYVYPIVTSAEEVSKVSVTAADDLFSISPAHALILSMRLTLQLRSVACESMDLYSSCQLGSQWWVYQSAVGRSSGKRCSGESSIRVE